LLGRDNLGQAGDGTGALVLVPGLVGGNMTFAAVSAGAAHACGVSILGAAFCWGYNAYGQLGDSAGANRLSPVLVRGGFAFVVLSAGGGHTCGLTAEGAAYCWGVNVYGQLGNGTATGEATTTGPSSPILVAAPAGVQFAAVSAGGGHTCGLTAAGAAYCWGGNGQGALGDGSANDSSSPVLVAGGVTFAETATSTPAVLLLRGPPTAGDGTSTASSAIVRQPRA
jgi:alpha-tubulin suppressor-like RCC1 family protein